MSVEPEGIVLYYLTHWIYLFKIKSQTSDLQVLVLRWYQLKTTPREIPNVYRGKNDTGVDRSPPVPSPPLPSVKMYCVLRTLHQDVLFLNRVNFTVLRILCDYTDQEIVLLLSDRPLYAPFMIVITIFWDFTFKFIRFSYL